MKDELSAMAQKDRRAKKLYEARMKREGNQRPPSVTKLPIHELRTGEAGKMSAEAQWIADNGWSGKQ
jgi:hypothetical protein